jgi:hypothetical protein
MLAEQAGLDRKSAGRVLTATIAANNDDFGAGSSTPWRVMSWELAAPAPVLVDDEITALRADLDAALDTLDKLRDQLQRTIKRLS